MEPTLAFTIGLAASLLTMLLPDMVRSLASAYRTRTYDRRRRARLTALVLTAAAAIGALRVPAGATTPPPSVRMVGPVAPSTQSVASHPADRYEVQPGDCLWRIARALLEQRGQPATGSDIERSWRAIYEANQAVIGSDPDLIHPGQLLERPEGM